jgi:hypothetical protein
MCLTLKSATRYTHRVINGRYRLSDHPEEPVDPVRVGTCQRCGEAFAVDFYLLSSGQNVAKVRYCSNECLVAVSVARRREGGARRVPPHVKTCDRCAAEFTAKRSDARFCSPRCRTAAHRAEQAGRVETSTE